jgi:hypothetical protein
MGNSRLLKVGFQQSNSGSEICPGILAQPRRYIHYKAVQSLQEWLRVAFNLSLSKSQYAGFNTLLR